MSTHTPQPSRPQPPLTDAPAPERDSVRFEPLNVLSLDMLLPVEQQAYSHPWSMACTPSAQRRWRCWRPT